MKPQPLAALVSVCLLTHGAVHAQATVQSSSDEARTLDAVQVTAQRRPEKLEDVPISLSVVEAETLNTYTAAAPDVLVLAGRVPSVNAESSFGRTFPRFYIRGLGNTDFDLNAHQPVSMVYDGVVLENPTLKGFPIFDLDRIEVLRGPQGTLFGRNTPGGVLKFESVRPDATPDGFLRLGIARFDTLNLEAAIGGAAGPGSAFRFSALQQERSDYVRNTALPDDRRGGFSESAFRGQWLLQPDDTFEALLQVRARRLDGGSALFRANGVVPGSNRLLPGTDRRTLAQDARPALEVDTLGASAQLRWEIGALSLVSISAYESVEMFARGDVDGGFGASFAPPSGPGFIPFPAESGDGIPEHRQLTQELRLESPTGGRTDWQLGAYFFDESLELDNISYDTLAGSVVNGLARQRQDARAQALFGTLRHAFADRWRIAAGLRYTRDEKDFTAERLRSPIGAGALAPISVSPDDSNLSGDLSLDFAASDTVRLYGRVATAYRAPSIQGRLLFGDTVSVADSEEILSLELGLKAELLERRLRLGLALFDYRLDDAQLTAVGGQTNFNTLVNADRVEGQGAELDLQALFGEHLKIDLGLSYNRTEIRDPGLFVQPCGGGCTVLDPPAGAGGLVSIDGNPLPQAPRRIAQLGANYARPLGNGEVFVRGDVSYRSEVDFFLYRSPEFTGAALTEVGLRAGYGWSGGRYRVSAFARNLFDRTVAVGGVDFNNLTVFLNEPRLVGLELELRR